MYSNRQSINLSANQLEALSRHLEQTAREIRLIVARLDDNTIQVANVRHLETILETTELFIRDLNRPVNVREQLRELDQQRGKPRRTRHKKI